MIFIGFFGRVAAVWSLFPLAPMVHSRRPSVRGLGPAFLSGDDRDFVDLAIAAIFLNLVGCYATNHGWT
jgi:hypothetical protein